MQRVEKPVCFLWSVLCLFESKSDGAEDETLGNIVLMTAFSPTFERIMLHSGQEIKSYLREMGVGSRTPCDEVTNTLLHGDSESFMIPQLPCVGEKYSAYWDSEIKFSPALMLQSENMIIYTSLLVFIHFLLAF